MKKTSTVKHITGSNTTLMQTPVTQIDDSSNQLPCEDKVGFKQTN